LNGLLAVIGMDFYRTKLRSSKFAMEPLQTLVEGVKTVRRLAQTKAYAPFFEREEIPGLQIQSDKQIIEFLRTNIQTMFHIIGTCKMGNDTMAVVDEHLRVHEIENLRVVDASIMPTIPSGNTNAPTIMIAEKLADEFGKK
jgi:choline dehydrogenase